jgi:hypothetical protein
VVSVQGTKQAKSGNSKAEDYYVKKGDSLLVLPKNILELQFQIL